MATHLCPVACNHGIQQFELLFPKGVELTDDQEENWERLADAIQAADNPGDMYFMVHAISPAALYDKDGFTCICASCSYDVPSNATAFYYCGLLAEAVAREGK